jgi:hypothetical protein
MSANSRMTSSIALPKLLGARFGRGIDGDPYAGIFVRRFGLAACRAAVVAEHAFAVMVS